MKRLPLRWVPAMLMATLLLCVPARAAETASENAIRAALLFNFLKFTEWQGLMPGSSHLQLCIATGDAEVLAEMEKLNARLVQGRALLVSRYRSPAACDVIYVDSRQRWHGLADKPAHALTVGDYRGFAGDGGMIEIAFLEGVTRFDINLVEAKRAGLRFYPQMLRLARRVIE